MSVFYPNVRFAFSSIDSIYDISLPSTDVYSLLSPDHNHQMQILDRTGMLQALDLTTDGLIKLYALVETGLINDLDINVDKVSTWFNVCIPHVFDMGHRDSCVECLSLMILRTDHQYKYYVQILYFDILWVPT